MQMPSKKSIHAVTGAFGSAGKYIAGELLSRGHRVVSLTDSYNRSNPLFVKDIAGIAVREGEARQNSLINCIGPETFSYRSLVETIGQIIRKQTPMISVPPKAGYFMGGDYRKAGQ
jgi:nucleoside-diphosphate-sugar epimerase